MLTVRSVVAPSCASSPFTLPWPPAMRRHPWVPSLGVLFVEARSGQTEGLGGRSGSLSERGMARLAAVERRAR